MAPTPVIFIALAIAAVRQHKQPVEYNFSGVTVMTATRIAPAIFPILFAAIAGRAPKTTALFMAEKGATLGTLESLIASQTLWKAFGSQLAMRRSAVVGAHVLLLWCLSPLGGQAALRLLEVKDLSQIGNTTVRYLDTGAASAVRNLFAIPGDLNFNELSAMPKLVITSPTSLKTLTKRARLDGFLGAMNSSETTDSSLNDSRNIILGSLGNGSDTTFANSSLTETHVESVVNCASSPTTLPPSCTVTKMRRSLNDARSPMLTPQDDSLVAFRFLSTLPYATGTTLYGSTPIEYFLEDSSLPPFRTETGIDCATRLHRRRRTSLRIPPFDYGPASNPASFNTSSFSDEEYMAIAEAPFPAASATATTSCAVKVYIRNFVCLTLLSVASSMLLLVGMAGALLKTRELAPDVLGYAASSTYDNPYARVPAGGVQDGMQRAWALRDGRVMVGEVWAEEKVGHVAFARVEGGGVGALREGMLYV
ncbi:hypothetical protein BJ546DRAFT_1063556 [Cryomyces antarcticus]